MKVTLSFVCSKCKASFNAFNGDLDELLDKNLEILMSKAVDAHNKQFGKWHDKYHK